MRHAGTGRSLWVMLVCVAVIGCAQPTEEATEEPAAQAETTYQASTAAPTSAQATLEPKSGSDVSGTVTFTVRDGEIEMELHVMGLPGEIHAAHIHEVGDCSADDGTSAGGHWNPTVVPHGEWGSQEFHLGDLGNLEPDESGHAMMTLTTDLWTMGDGSNTDVVGKAIIVHAQADDFTTQPTGAAGGRIACGVIEK